MESWVNLSGKEGHTDIQPLMRPGIEPGTFRLGGRDLTTAPTPPLKLHWKVFSWTDYFFLQETLASFLQKVFPILGSFTSDPEVKVTVPCIIDILFKKLNCILDWTFSEYRWRPVIVSYCCWCGNENTLLVVTHQSYFISPTGIKTKNIVRNHIHFSDVQYPERVMYPKTIGNYYKYIFCSS